MKAMLLAAGLGTRLRPLTDAIPKPLLPVGKKTLIEYHLENIRKMGIEEVVINVFYHAKKMIDFLGDGSRYGVRITYSHEKDLLGTGGGIYQALPLLGKDPFIIISADVWSDFAFDADFIKADQDAHLVLVENPDYHLKGDYSLTTEGKIAFTGKKFTYAGIAKLHPKLFSHCKAGAFSLSPILNQAIENQTVSGEVFQGRWFNVGTLEELEKLRKLFD